MFTLGSAIDALKWLLKHGADYHKANRQQETPLDWAKKNSKRDVMMTLRDWIALKVWTPCRHLISLSRFSTHENSKLRAGVCH